MSSSEGQLLAAWGWGEHEQTHWSTMLANCIPARVTTRYPSSWRVVLPVAGAGAAAGAGALVELSGAFQYLVASPEEYPVVGDWVALTPDLRFIQQVLPRRSWLSRQEAGRATRAQVLAANIDLALLVFGLDGGRNFSVGLLERFLTLVSAGGVAPVVVLNKVDCAASAHIEAVQRQVAAIQAAIQATVPIVLTSTRSGLGLDELRTLIPAGTTACCLGRSGVGKSSIMNALAGEELMPTAEVSRNQSKGRHTTSTSHLIMLQGGGMLIDTPGLRELQLWGTEDSLAQSFADIQEFAAECRFRNCQHQGEPGCAVQQAAAEGVLPQQRLEHYLEQRDELSEATQRAQMSADAYEKQKWKKITKDIRRLYRP